jgi:hypothetical protein
MKQQIFDTQQPRILYGHSGKVYLNLNETEVQVEVPDHEGNPEMVTKYQYDVDELVCSLQTEDEVLEAYKAQKQAELAAFDSSSAVNEFTLNGYPMWLDKATRVGLNNSINIEKKAGKTKTTMWFGGIPITVTITVALNLLSQIEIYALDCYNKTAEHAAAIGQLDTLENIMAYDYTTGYPEKLDLTLG